MSRPEGYSYDELVKMGAKPGGYTFEELQSLGAKPAPELQSSFGDPRSAGQVALGQIGDVGRGIVHAVTGIPSTIGAIAGAVGSPRKQYEVVKGMAEGIAQPFTAAARGIGSYFAPESVTAPNTQEWQQAAQGAGTQLGGLAIGELAKPVGRIANETVRTGLRAVTTPEAMEARAAANKAVALKPNTLENRAAAQTISPELSRRRMAEGLRGKTIDKNLADAHTNAGRWVNAAEQRLIQDVRPERQMSRQTMLDEVQDAANNLDPDLFPGARSALQRAANRIAREEEFIKPKEGIKLRRDLDKVADEMGAFGETGAAADKVTSTTFRHTADMVRRNLNEMDPGLKTANHEYWLTRKGLDIAKRRQLGEVGTVGTGLPGRGSLLDDLIASGIGGSVAGPVGAGVAEGLNLARQSRGYANVKSGIQQSLADFIRQPQRQPAGLLGTGWRDMPEAVGESSVTGEFAMPEPATREIRTGRLLTAGTPPPSGTPAYPEATPTFQMPASNINRAETVPTEASRNQGMHHTPSGFQARLEKAKKLRKK